MFPAKTIKEAEKFMVEQPQVECPVFHKFSPGLYIRELHIPVGTIALGHYQRFENLCFMVKGKLLFHNDDGTNTVMEAPHVFTAPPGRKLAYAMEDVIFTNVHVNPDDERDIDVLEERLLDKSVALPLKVPTVQEIEGVLCQQSQPQ